MQPMSNFVFNASVNVIGGGVQESVNFILESLKDSEVRWHYLLSPAVEDQLVRAGVSLESSLLVANTPARSRKSRRFLANYVRKLNASAVLTVAGPAYVDFPIPHIMGIANAFITHASWSVLLRSGIKHALTVLYRMRFVRKADGWIFQTNSARRGFLSRFRVDPGKTAVISNSCGANYYSNNCDYLNDLEAPGKTSTLVILVPAADYGHKNVKIIPRMARALRSILPHRNFEFLLTLPPASPTWKSIVRDSKRLGVTDVVKNHGPFPLSEGPALYRQSHIMLLPSRLETFSANYLEAMATGRLIVTSDMDFAREVCCDAALYFNPDRPEEGALCLAEIIMNPERSKDLRRRAKLRLAEFPDIHGRYTLLKKALEDLVPAKKFAR